MTEKDNWEKYKKLVLAELDRSNEMHKRTDERIARLTVAVTVLKVKAGIWGTVGGLVSVAAYALVNKI